MRERLRSRELAAVIGSAAILAPLTTIGITNESIQYDSTPAHSEDCDSTLWRRVHTRDRLKIIDTCIEVSGSIERMDAKRDGDIHIDLNLDKEFDWIRKDPRFENNNLQQNGNLVTEAVCAVPIEDIRVFIQFPCEGFSQDFDVEVGDHVTMVGAFVHDKTHNWLEVHPITSIEHFKEPDREITIFE